MPVVFRQQGFRFPFFSNEGNPREPVHVHVSKGDADAKLWIYPVVGIAGCDGFDARTQRWLVEVVAANRTLIEDAWNAHFS